MSRLRKQRALVELRARDVEHARRAAGAARDQLLYVVRRKLGSRRGLAGAFIAGLLWGSRPARGAAAGRPWSHRARGLLAAASWLTRQLRQTPV
jgi:hypothetical protein